MSWHREEVQVSLFPLPPRMPDYRRIQCRCGCGLWWYSARTPGRPPAYVNREHALAAQRIRRRRMAQ